ncbi:Glycoprotein-N-acetylgalactosamine 3-beta-galactosyltransferase [Fasciolopsis buskii]|uniref:N-acetylgalactosaminide beta-1,3-galactosyltransferase n=1 Tax=Fasciolopsis buskii TaxID=27845 RepID=A0A8E0VJ92_9TREM|nr:Glycoprotein-N-acetylgalactosamine 3-beta-galactosyltransferase [Fasciolopsis buski]
MDGSFVCFTDGNRRVLSLLFGFAIGFCFSAYFSPLNWIIGRQAVTCHPTVLRPLHSDISSTKNSGGPSVLCWITVMPSNHERKARHIKATWAKRCDKHIFMSSVDDSDLPSIAAVQYESRDMLWNKTHFALTYIGNNFGKKFDYFFKADDDTYVVVENLRKLLSTYNPEVPFILGYKHARFFAQGYPSGGAGYVLSRAALRMMVKGFQTEEDCHSAAHSDNEDVKIGMCAQTLGIPLIDSRDSRGYHHFEYRSPFQLLNSSHFDAPYSFLPDQTRVDCCADYMVTFHYIEPHELYFMDFLIYHVLHPPLEGS